MKQAPNKIIACPYKVLHIDARNGNLRLKCGHHKIQRLQTHGSGQAIMETTKEFLDC